MPENMDIMDNVLKTLDVDTNEISHQDLQEVMLIVKKTCSGSQQSMDYYDKFVTKLWSHLTNELNEFDNQLLCCTCFFSVLSHSKQQEIYLRKAFNIIKNEILLKKVKCYDKGNPTVAVSLCYGLFQSSYLIQQEDKSLDILEQVLKATFQLLTILAYEYSEYTFIVFKIMTGFKKVIETPFQEFLFNKDNNIQLLNLINHNWENPITGVRNLNRLMFQMLLLVLNYDIFENVLNEINGFYWNKAKLLMLTEVIEHSNGLIDDLVMKNQLIHGLISSLHNSGLVSAGADMYHAILKKLGSDESWLKLFQSSVMEILTGRSFKVVENFCNYWCLTTFKKFPTLAKIIINDLQKLDESELKLYSCLSIIKQANKLGLIEKTWLLPMCNEEENLVLRCLEHSNTCVRMFAFEIISCSQRKSLPFDIEYQVILKFIRNNVNSDCTVLRLSTLNGLANFFTILHTSFLNNFKLDNTSELFNLLNFCKNVQIFILDSLSLNGNYQRKITTVKITYILLKHFNEIPRKKQKQAKNTNISLVRYLEEKGHWLLNATDFIKTLINLLKDPSADIHDCILHLLLEFYLPDLSQTVMMDYLIEKGLECMGSKYFFQINSGLNILKLVINIILNKDVAAKFKNVEDIFYFTYNVIIEEYKTTKDVVESIAKGKQLHSFISLICIIFDIASKNSYQLAVSTETIFTLLGVLKDVSNQFAWEDTTNTSSDFSKMNDMVLSIIKSSSDDKTTDETKVSGLYQIVLNCLWLNVKASCELATILIQYYKENIRVCEESLKIIIHVLETSRHKGAIEAAGAALGHGIRYLTSAGVKSEVSKLALSLLKRKLNELLSETTKMSSVTRRGAGLSIMIHRIVSNDAKKGKPLFQYFMKSILNTFCSPQMISENHQELNDETDLPKAIYIHFLTRIVTDSSLASDIMYYSAQLAELAFTNLINPQWQIRNAALQLYGALIPKLIGQKKPSGTDDEIMSAVACDEFRTHSPQLWAAIIKQIKNNGSHYIIEDHSNLVPLLNTLANIAQRYNFSYDISKQVDFDLNLLPHFFILLGSPIYTVRRLTSMCVINIYPFETIQRNLNKMIITSENQLHGMLMVIENCYKFYSDNILYINHLNNLRNKYHEVILKSNHSYLCMWCMEKLFPQDNQEITIEIINNILCKERTIFQEPGSFLWLNQNIQRCIEKVSWQLLPEVTSLLLKTFYFEKYCQIIIQRIKNSKVVPKQILLDVSNILLYSNLKMKSSLIWETLYIISQKIKLNMDISYSFLNEHLSYNVSYNMRYIVPLGARILANQVDNNNLLLLSKKIFLLCNPEGNDTEMRYIAAIANNELAYQFRSFSDEVRINAVKAAVILLQDEDEDVRIVSVKFHKRLANLLYTKHPFICINEILKWEFLHKQFNEPVSSIQTICKDLLHFVDTSKRSEVEELNPFTNDSKNIYLEDNVLQQLLVNLIKKE